MNKYDHHMIIIELKPVRDLLDESSPRTYTKCHSFQYHSVCKKLKARFPLTKRWERKEKKRNKPES